MIINREEYAVEIECKEAINRGFQVVNDFSRIRINNRCINSKFSINKSAIVLILCLKILSLSIIIIVS